MVSACLDRGMCVSANAGSRQVITILRPEEGARAEGFQFYQLRDHS